MSWAGTFRSMRAYTTSANEQGNQARVPTGGLAMAVVAVAGFCRWSAHSCGFRAKHAPQGVGRDMGARGGRAHTSGNPNLNLALAHFPLDVSNKSKRLMVPSASCHVPLPTLGRGTATEQTLRPSGYLPGQRDPCLGPTYLCTRPTTAHAIQAEVGPAVFDPGAGESHVRRLGTQSPATCDCKLSSRLRGGSRASDKHSTAADRVHYILTWQHVVGVISRVPVNMLKTIIEAIYVDPPEPTPLVVSHHDGWATVTCKGECM